jgi:hypothetical protein
MTPIGIVGAGIAGLHLALYLQKHGVPVTLHADRTPDEIRASRLPNTQSLLGASRARDAELGTNHWDGLGLDTTTVRFEIAGEPPLAFSGTFDRPGLFIDMRVYLPRAMEDFAARGGTIVFGAQSADDVARLAEGHALLVVATGRGGLSAMFPRDPERSPYEVAQRRVIAGLYHGVRPASPGTIEYNILPGLGEMFEAQIVTAHGSAGAVVFEAIPGGPLEPVTQLRYDDGPAAFNAAMLEAVRRYTPSTYARIDPAAFALTSPLDVFTGAVVPMVRHGLVALPGGRFAIAIGDTHTAIDPISGQGGNAASRSAWLLGEMVTAHFQTGGRFDEAFCARAEQRLWEAVRAATEWTNALLAPPPPHVIGLFVAAAQNRAIADAFATNFDYTDRQWAVLSSPEATASFIASSGVVAGPHPDAE